MAAESPVVRHRLIIAQSGAGGSVLVYGGALPLIVTDDRHTAEVDYINALVAERFGLRTVVLRSLEHSDADASDGSFDRVHVLEVIGDDSSRRDLQWALPHTLAFVDRIDGDALALWLRDRNSPIVDGREWTQPGWFGEVVAWIERALHSTGEQVVEIVQLRTWATSCVLRIRTDDGRNGRADHYFKALPASGAVEATLTRHLGQHFPDVVPQIVAAEPARRWLLMTACRGQKLEQIADIAVWERAANRYARLQMACIDRVAALKALGCPARDLEQLARSIESLAADAALLPQPGGLTQAEHRRFVALVPELRRRCDELAACGIPYSLEHGDFWPGNVFCDDASCVVIDWEDAVVSHPFFSLAPLTVGLINAGLGSSENVARVERAYTSAFAPLAPPDRLRRAIELALPLCFFDMAARYRRQRPSMVRLHPWMRDLVPQTVRLALSRLGQTGESGVQ